MSDGHVASLRVGALYPQSELGRAQGSSGPTSHHVMQRKLRARAGTAHRENFTVNLMILKHQGPFSCTGPFQGPCITWGSPEEQKQQGVCVRVCLCVRERDRERERCISRN